MTNLYLLCTLCPGRHNIELSPRGALSPWETLTHDSLFPGVTDDTQTLKTRDNPIQEYQSSTAHTMEEGSSPLMPETQISL
jgi:hypothetical protein